MKYRNFQIANENRVTRNGIAAMMTLTLMVIITLADSDDGYVRERGTARARRFRFVT